MAANSPGERYQMIRICLSGGSWNALLYNPAFRRPDIKYPIRGSGHVLTGQRKRCDIRRRWKMSVADRKGGPSTCARCRDLSGSTPSGFSKRKRAAMLSGTREHHTLDDSISYPDMLSESLTTVSKPCYSPRSAALQWCVRTPYPDIFAMDSK